MGQAQTKRVHKFKSKEEYFIKNGGILLEKQLALSQDQHLVGQLKIFSQKEINNATNNFDPNLILAGNHNLVAYKGTLDDRLIFVLAPHDCYPFPELVDIFLTELSTLMVTRHENITKIYGCCLGTRVPLIVCEYPPKLQSLHAYLYGDLGLKEPLKWRGCLKVVTDVAYALSYMHNAFSKPLILRDINSYDVGVSLDSSFHAMLVSFAYSVSITPGKENQMWPVYGTPGYIDPEYVETKEVTDKCDVYSFGVLMLELLIKVNPVEMMRCGKDLVIEVVSEVERNGCMKEMVDGSVMEEGNMGEIQRFAELGLKCVAKKGVERPTMISVVEELWLIQDQDNSRCACNP